MYLVTFLPYSSLSRDNEAFRPRGRSQHGVAKNDDKKKAAEAKKRKQEAKAKEKEEKEKRDKERRSQQT